jgi:hypothetical protein
MPLFPSSGTYQLHSWSRPLIGWSRVSVVKMSVEHFTKALTTPVFPSIDTMVLPALVHAIHKPTPTQTENAEIPQALLPVSEFYKHQLLNPQPPVFQDLLFLPAFYQNPNRHREIITSMAYRHILDCPVQAEPHDWECSACCAEYKAGVHIPTSLP